MDPPPKSLNPLGAGKDRKPEARTRQQMVRQGGQQSRSSMLQVAAGENRWEIID